MAVMREWVHGGERLVCTVRRGAAKIFSEGVVLSDGDAGAFVTG